MSQHSPVNFDFTGWTLDEARTACSNLPQAIELRVVETAPPLKPAREMQTRAPKKLKAGQEKRAPRPSPRWGEWRVLRCSSIESSNSQIIELLVAREELAPQQPAPQ